jgi:hypothetical protein
MTTASVVLEGASSECKHPFPSVIPFAAAGSRTSRRSKCRGNANTVTKIAVGTVELFPSLLLNVASGPRSQLLRYDA